MGAGREKMTLEIKSISKEFAAFEDIQRNLEHLLAGCIFGCTNITYEECIKGKIFGLPRSHLIYVHHIKPGLPIFLFNYSSKKLYGVFVAVSKGQLDINPHGWTKTQNSKTLYPAQVCVEILQQCKPLSESEFKPIITSNYTSDKHFLFELDKIQVEDLCKKFGCPVPSAATLKEKFKINNVQSVFDEIEDFPKLNSLSTRDESKISFDNSKDKAYNNSYKNLQWKNFVTMKNKSVKEEITATSVAFPNTLPSKPAVVNPQNCIWRIKRQESALNKDVGNLKQSTKPLWLSTTKFPEAANKNPDKSFITLSKEKSFSPLAINNNKVVPDSQNITETKSRENTNEEKNKEENPNNIVESKKAFKKKYKALKKGRRGWNDPSMGMMEINAETKDWFEWHKESIEQISDKSLLTKNDIEAFQDIKKQIEAEVKKENTPETNSIKEIKKSEDKRDFKKLPNPNRNAAASVGKLEIGDIIKNIDLLNLDKDKNVALDENGLLEKPNVSYAPSVISVSDCKDTYSAETNNLQVAQQDVIEKNNKNKIEIITLTDTCNDDCDDANDIDMIFEILSLMPGGNCERLYLFGGLDNDYNHNKAEAFNTRTCDWSEICKLPMQEFVYGSAAATSNCKIILGGGYNIETLTSKVYYLRAGSIEWASASCMKEARAHFTSLGINGKVLVSGGLTKGGSSNLVEIFYLDKDQWVSGPVMIERRCYLDATVRDNVVYAFGGSDGSQILQSSEFLDIREKQWHKLTVMPRCKRNLCVEAYEETIWTMGGYDGNSNLVEVDVFDIRNQKWLSKPILNIPHVAGTSAVVDGELFLIGGLVDIKNYEMANTMERYDFFNNKWVDITGIGCENGCRAFHASCVSS